MNSYTLESFINFCDDIQIAEESAKDMETIFNEAISKMKVLKQKIKNTDNIDEILKILSDENHILIEVKNNLQSTKYSASDYIKGNAKIIQSVAVSIPVIVGCLYANKKMKGDISKKDIMTFGSMIGTGVTAGIAGNHIRKNINENVLQTKKNLIGELDKLLSLNNTTKNTMNKIKSMKFDTLSEFRKNRYIVKIDDNGDIKIVKMVGFD